jgi:DNA adenine methylase
MNSPIKYFGGKGTMYNNIIQYFPSPDEYDLYIEPFGGSYSIGLKLDPIPKMEIYNDIDNNVYALYKVISDDKLFNEFKEKLDLIPSYVDTIRREFKDYLKQDDLTLVQRAVYFFYVNRTSHNGVGGFSLNTYIRRNMSKAVSDYLSSIDRLPELHNRLSRVIVSNMDGINLIEKYKNNERALIYCDPPYEQSTRTSARYNVDMNKDGHIRFLDTVINSKSKIIISGYDCDLYDQLIENGFKKIHFNVKTINGKFKPITKQETLWIN